MIIDLTISNIIVQPELNSAQIVITPTFSSGGGGGGVTNYDLLTNKPKINNVELTGNKTSADLSLATAAQGAKADNAEPAIIKNTGLLSWTGSAWAWITTTFQNAANKVTSWSATTLDENYPSEKLVKDSLDLKQDELPFPPIPVGDVLTDDGTFKPITSAVGGYANNLYFSFDDNSIDGIKVLSYIPDVAANILSVAVTGGTGGDGDKLFQSFIYPDVVSTTQIPSGLWSFALYGYVSSAMGATYIGARYWKYSALGVKTYLFPAIAWSAELNNLLAAANYIQFQTVQMVFNVDPTDRMGCDLFIKTSGASRTVSIVLGDGNASYLNNPNAIRHTSVRAVNQDLTVQHIDSTTEKTTPIDADKLALWNSVELKYVSTKISDFVAWLKGIFETIMNNSSIVPTTTDIIPDFSSDIYLISNTQAASETAVSNSTYVNMPTRTGFKTVRFYNAFTATRTLTLYGTATLILGGITYTFQYINSNIIAVPTLKTLEISYEFIFTSSTACTVSIISALQS